MSFLTLGGGGGGAPVPPDDWVPPSLTDETGVSHIQVAVAQVLPEFEYLGELLQAIVLDGRWEDDQGSGGVMILAPTDDLSIDLLTDDHETWGEVGTTGRLNIVNRELHVVVDGNVVGCFAPRGQAKVDRGVVTLDCVSLVDAYFPTRTLGRQPTDLLNGQGTFPDGDLPPSITWTGDPGDIDFIEGPRDTWAVAIRGDAFSSAPDQLLVNVEMALEETTTFNNIVRMAAFMRVPSVGDDLDGQLLMTMERYDDGNPTRVWPEAGQAWPEETIAVVDESRATGDWEGSPVTAAAVAKKGPYDSLFRGRVYPVSETEWTAIDEIRVFRRDNLGTGDPRDLVRHLSLLCTDAQDTEHKSTWNLRVVVGADCGIEEVGIWYRETYQPLQDAINAICDREGGPVKPWVDYQRQIRCQASRGVDRSETVTIGPDDIVNPTGWTHDVGAQVSQVTANSSMGSDYWVHRSVSTDTSRSEGHLVEFLTRAPNDMGLRPLDGWTDRQLAERSQPQETATILLRPEKGWLLGVGDRFRLVQFDGRVRLDRLVTVTRRTFYEGRRLIGLDVGVDEAA